MSLDISGRKVSIFTWPGCSAGRDPACDGKGYGVSPIAAGVLRPNGDLSLTTRRRAATTLASNCRCGNTWMILSTDSKYPSRRAYVVKLRSDATPDALIGRLENLVTGRRYEFTSAHELFRLIVGDIVEPATPDGL